MVDPPFFACRHPILCAAMNQVSDLALAIAVQRAGCLPSLAIANYIEGQRFDSAAYQQDLHDFQNATGSTNLLLSIGGSLLLQEAVTRPFLELGYRHIELFHGMHTDPAWPAILARSQRLRDDLGARFVFKMSTGHVGPGLDYDTVLLKGPEGAGRSSADAPSLDAGFAACRRLHPALPVIVSGGIHGHAQVQDYLRAGAIGVAVGSLFAATLESRVSPEVKRKLVQANAIDLQVQGEARLRGLFASTVAGDGSNLTRTLSVGIRRPDAGGIFVGSAIDHITDIVSVQAVVDRLTQPASEPSA